MRPWYSLDDSCLYHTAPGTAWLGKLHNEAQDASIFAAKTATPTSSMKVTSRLVSWLSGQEPAMGNKWPQATGQLR